MSSGLTARFHPSLDEIAAGEWNALLPDDNPFLDHAFLAGLERHGCLRATFGWRANHLALYAGKRLVAAAPLYLKRNSHGEYVFDWSWAGAYERAGLDYYPKLLCAVPYSPVTGTRLLAGRGEDARELRKALIGTIAAAVGGSGLSSAHVNFVSSADAECFERADGWLARFDWQFHWSNRGWRDFDDFLGALTHKKRKNIRHERTQVAAAGVVCEVRHGDELDPGDWAAIHALYLNTFEERGNHPALTLGFFRHLGTAMPRRVLAVLCKREGEIVAMALLLRSSDTLYGRHWGCREQIAGLHFEACYYQGIDYCLRHGLARFEPGAQGEHKLARGFLPTRTRSFHYLADTRFRAAVREAMEREANALDDYHSELMAHAPYAARGVLPGEAATVESATPSPPKPSLEGDG